MVVHKLSHLVKDWLLNCGWFSQGNISKSKEFKVDRFFINESDFFTVESHQAFSFCVRPCEQAAVKLVWVLYWKLNWWGLIIKVSLEVFKPTVGGVLHDECSLCRLEVFTELKDIFLLFRCRHGEIFVHNNIT